MSTTLHAVNGHELAETRNCRIAGCPRPAEPSSPTRGVWANLCAECHSAEVKRRREARAGSAAAGSPSGRSAGSFEKRARGLVEVGRRLDRAVAKFHPAKVEFDEAQAEWRRLCREIGGES